MMLVPPIYWLFFIGCSVIVGYYFTFLLVTQKKGNRKANVFLAAFIFIVAYFLTVRVIVLSGFYREFPYLLGTAVPIWYLAGPLFYFYVKVHLIHDYKLKVLDLFHGLPFVISTILAFNIITKSGSEKIYLLENPQTSTSEIFPLNFIPFIILVGYFLLSLKLIRNSLASYKDFFSNTKIDQLEWIKRLLTVYVFYLTFDILASFSFSLFNMPFTQIKFLTLFAMSLFVHFTAYYSFKHQGSIFYKQNEKLKKYQTSNLSIETIDSYFEQLNKIMIGEKLYLNNNLSLPDLAEKLNLTSHQISQIINQKYNSNFYDYINSFRIEAAKEILADPNFKHLSVFGVGLDVGFNSKTSFNSNFKKFENITPSAFRKRFN